MNHSVKNFGGFHWTNDLPNLGRFEMFVSFVLFGAFAVAVLGKAFLPRLEETTL